MTSRKELTTTLTLDGIGSDFCSHRHLVMLLGSNVRINFLAFWFQLVFTQKALQQFARTFSKKPSVNVAYAIYADLPVILKMLLIFKYICFIW